MAETPINTRVFNVRPIGIYRYTDEKYIQREGKGEGKTANLAVMHKKETGHRIRIGDVGGRR